EAALPTLLVAFARGNRREDSLMKHHLGAAIMLCQCDGDERFRPRVAALIHPQVREHQPLGRDDLAIDPAQAVLGALGRAHGGGEAAADTQITALPGEAEPARTGPPREQLWLGPGTE